jgi:DNA-directed RNA polymerase specialized sigma24 family protein
MADKGSVSLWIGRLKSGEGQAAQDIWERYFRRLVGLARAKLGAAPRQAADEEDVALSAFDSFCRGAEAGRFPRLDDRDDLWQLLVLLTARKASNLRRFETRQKRGGGRVQHGSALPDGDTVDDNVFAQLVDPEPTPQFAAQLAEECKRLLDGLGDDGLRAVALAKMEGYTNAEIAGRLGCVVTTVERRLKTIRRIWSQAEAGS